MPPGFRIFSVLFIGMMLTRLLQAQIQAPLNLYHSGCKSLGFSRTPDCMAAFHRYCTNNKYGGAGYPQEVGTTELGFLCASTIWYGDVAYGNLPNCYGATQSVGCYSSAHRFCTKIDKDGIGIVQEVGNNGAVGLACVPYAWYGLVGIDALRDLHPGCTTPGQSQTSDCVAAVHRYCTGNGYGVGGVITEVRAYQVELGCISAATYRTNRVTGI